ncbi:MAG: hypothetical protein A3C90_03000 [Candidatus Magasanikbacteria bacterium RIFCSPHIGHO2_02_FULL_51_14]|uniref:Uncharacterized protein n=1 Tax=Candidatus Magasanikbacteria bacterium RIFCSPHIGHO2_02_FULL_51_14 TaxID=1798683 RepID=A0A1F6MFT5_9BACT|nr:MAG: hypothetical protein A3C90_03000 [Candidatus Magasanikbacteria bacterium RIFCSPHIGHO2_02_FULL_51_14]
MDQFLLTLLRAVGIQLLGVFGVFFLFGFALSIVQGATHKVYRRSVGWKGILWTAWIGTTIHEFGHIVFAKIFRHKIGRVSLFQPDERQGDLGLVDHSFNKWNIWHRVGNFFIGAAPMFFGSAFLALMVYFLLPNGKNVFLPLTNGFTSVDVAFQSLKATLANLFTFENLKAWNFWLFLYLSFAIASHLAPSKIDRKGMWNGFIWIVGLVILANIVALLLGVDLTKYILRVNQYLSIFFAIFTYALIISVIHLLLAAVVLWPFKK